MFSMYYIQFSTQGENCNRLLGSLSTAVDNRATQISKSKLEWSCSKFFAIIYSQLNISRPNPFGIPKGYGRKAR